jgi:hypothetical protein
MKADISQTGIHLSQWTVTKKNDPRPIDGQVIQNFYSLSHIHTSIPQAVMTRFFLGNTELYRAWGFLDEEHCRFHAILLNSIPKPTQGCPPVIVTYIGGIDMLSMGTDSSLLLPITLSK